ncbi:hemagglutinin repeat-containing protein [Komagataeibacter xylinus]|uniref:hemagglutinin repeat-containing protein n=1 Tax=Komagataeibacter xylinus TaxID=28448 RepID=UPI001A927DF4|nr:hemagglutinin repeat-containing protein [Komagataeibacter xylinus]
MPPDRSFIVHAKRCLAYHPHDGLSYTRTVEHGFLNKTTTTSSESSTDQVGSTVAANDNVTMVSGRDMSVAGTVAGGGNVTLQAGGTFTENALKDTAQSAYSQEKSGLFVGTSGAGFEVGFGKSRQTANDSSTTWTPSEIGSTGGDVTVAAGGPVTINASGLEAAKDLNVSGSSVSFNALSNVAKDSQTSDSSFIGLKAGLSDNSVVGQVADMALSAAQAANDKDTGNRALDAASAGISGAQAGMSIAQALSKDAASGEVELVGVKAEVGFSHDRQAESSTTTTVQGSMAAAGDALTVTATGTGRGTVDSNAGDIIATASQLSGQTVTLNAPGTVTLQSGQDTTHTTSSQSSESAFIGATASLSSDGGFGVSVTGQVGGSHAQSDARSATQVDTTVTGTDNVTINNAGGATTLDGAKVSGGAVDVTTGSLDIASAQNTASYSSNQESGGFSFAIPVYGVGGEKGFSVNASGGALGDTYASTEASGLSGIHAGNGGVNIAVAGNTSLDAGVIESTAASALNSLTTGSLTASGEKNVSDYAGASASFSFSTMQGGGDTDSAGFADNGMPMASAGVVAGSHETESQSAIGSNITVETGATSGTLSRDPSSANQAIANDFDASKESNVLALANEAETVTQAAAWTAKQGYDMASEGADDRATVGTDARDAQPTQDSAAGTGDATSSGLRPDRFGEDGGPGGFETLDLRMGPGIKRGDSTGNNVGADVPQPVEPDVANPWDTTTRVHRENVLRLDSSGGLTVAPDMANEYPGAEVAMTDRFGPGVAHYSPDAVVSGMGIGDLGISIPGAGTYRSTGMFTDRGDLKFTKDGSSDIYILGAPGPVDYTKIVDYTKTMGGKVSAETLSLTGRDNEVSSSSNSIDAGGMQDAPASLSGGINIDSLPSIEKNYLNNNILYHYTTESALKKILESGYLNPSLKEKNPKDARYGDGQYLTDVAPGTTTPAKLSRALVGLPWSGDKFTHYLAIDTTGLNVILGRKNVFVVPNSGPLDISDRLTSSGKVK